MKAIKYLLICSIASILFSSCGVATGLNTTMYPNNPVQTQVRLQEKNFKVIGSVKGEWSAKYVLGIGGFSKQSLMNSAISDMYEKANLTGSQTIVNVTSVISIKQIVWGVYIERTATVTGTIIEFTE